jgi:hypothetical protein
MFRLLVVLAVATIPAALCYSSGAPAGACSDGIPQHHVDPQKTPAPYDISLSTSKIRSGESVEITIKGKSSEDTIKGLLVKAVVGNTPVGKFEVAPNDPNIQTLDCGNSKNNAVTHKKIANGVRSVKFNWIAPRGLSEKVVFVSTIALNGGKFWVDQKSQTLSVN